MGLCCAKLCMPGMMNQMDAQTRALGGDPKAAAKGNGMGRFGVGAGLAGAIMANVGAQLQAAAEQQRQEAWRLYRAGPELRADGKLILNYVEDLWAFSPAYPTYLAVVIAQDAYWGVLRNVNAIIGAARDASGQANYKSDITGSIGANLMQGNIAALSNSGNIQDHVAKAQAATQAKEAAMIQVRQFLFLTNRESPAVQWNLDRTEYATRHYVNGHDGMPGRYETRWHVKFTVEITIVGGPAALPASAVSAGLSVPPVVPADAMTEETWATTRHPPPASPPAPAPMPAFVEGQFTKTA